jgi:deferrochelatase/peroxidase EfeB
MSDLDRGDIQGFILRTYAMPALRVIGLGIGDVEPARRFLGSLVNGASSLPQLTTAVDWPVKPDHCVNVGLTAAGLAALQLPAESLASFPEEFTQGPIPRAAHIGDTGDSSPEKWKPPFADGSLHALLFLFAESEPILDGVTAALRAAYSPSMTELSVLEARALPGNVAHFGYRDGFAQPAIEGGLPPLMPDVLPRAPSGEFVLGYPSQYADFTYPVPVPAELGKNGSFIAFRILEQDCRAFEQFLSASATATGLDRELIAAKLCGRWRNGVPLTVSPDSPNPTPDLPLEKYNTFDYVPTESLPGIYDDHRGYRCPIGSHIRRMNPRNSPVAGNSGLKRRIIRRGLPYGPPYDPAHPDDGIERGLLGLLINVSLKDQFEFLMSDWANNGQFAPGLGTTKDPFLGDNSGPDAKFLLPVEGRKPVELTGLPRFVKTRGAAYCYLPSATALRYLSTMGQG